MKYLTEDLMIIKPARYARSRKKYNQNDWGKFKSNGWDIKGRVQEIYSEEKYTGAYRDKPNSSWYIYLVDNIEQIKFNGIGQTQDERELERKKKLRR